MKRKKFIKLNFDNDDSYHHYEDEQIGPCKPGNSFYNFLTKGSVPFKVPIPDTLTIGYGSGSSASSTVKLLTYDYRKDCLVTHTAQFDNQDQRDTFFNLCFDKFMIPQTYTYRQEEKDGFSGKNLTKAKVPGGGEGDKEGPEDDQKNTKKVQSDVPNHLKEDYFENAPLFNRFVGIQKKPVTMSRFQGSSGGNGDVAVNVRPSSAKQKKHIMKGTSSSNNRERTVAASTAGKRYNRAYTHQHCETVLSFALHALLLELADRSKSEHNSDSDGFSPYIIQRFVKSRGKRPSIYRIFWKNGGASSLLAEGWNIAKAEEEFVLPDLVLRNSTQVNLSNSPEREGTTAAGDKHNPNFEPQHRFGHNEDNIVQKDEFNFQKTTTKFITNLLFMGKRKKEQEALELKEKELAKAVVQNLAPQTNSMPFSHTNKSAKVNKIPIQVAQASPTLTTATTQLPFVSQPPTPSKKPLGGKPAMQRQDSSFTFNSDVIDNTFLTSNPNQASSSNPKNSAPLKSAMKGAVTTTTAATTSSAADVATTAFSNQNGESPLKKKVLDFLDNISTPELDEYFVKGMQSQVVMTSSERAEALSINAKISHQYLDSITSSISNNMDGELNDAKIDKLIVTRVSHAALSTPIGYMTEIAHWLSNTINSVYKLNIQIESMVCDFIKDDFGRWYFVNLKGFKIHQECIPRVRLWHHVSVLHRPESELVKVHSLTSKERKLKHEAELGTVCKLCGIHYVDHARIRKQVKQLSASILAFIAQEQKIPKLDPEEEISIPAFGYQLTALGAMVVALAYHNHKMSLTTYAQTVLAFYQLHFSTNTRSALFAHGILDGSHEVKGCVCCFYCQEIYQRYANVNQTHRKLYALLGCHPSTATGSEQSNNSTVRTSSPNKVIGASSRLYSNPALSLSINTPSAVNAHQIKEVEGISENEGISSIRPKSANSTSKARLNNSSSPLLRPKSAGSRPGSPSMQSTSMLTGSRAGHKKYSLPIGAMKDIPLYDFLRRVQQHSQQLYSSHNATGTTKSRQNKQLPAPKSSDTYISYHALPRNISYFRMLLMTHCLIIDQHLDVLKARNPRLPTYFCLVYSLGQQMHYLPFKLDADNRDSSNTIVIDFNPMGKAITMLPIQECRMHSLFANKASLLSYLREKLITIKLFSAEDASMTSALNFEGECSLSLNRLNLLDTSSLLDGLTKEDEIVYFPSKSFGHVALKLSYAMNMTANMPETFANLLEVTNLKTDATSSNDELAAKKDSFFHEYEGIYWPNSTFYPMMTSLPFAWMSMLTLTPNKMAFIQALQEVPQVLFDNSVPPSPEQSPSWQQSAHRKSMSSHQILPSQPTKWSQATASGHHLIHPAHRHRHNEDDEEEGEENLLDMLDAELLKEEHHVRKEIEQLKLKSHSHHPTSANNNSHDAHVPEETNANRQQSLRRTLLRNSILMDQRLLAKPHQASQGHQHHYSGANGSPPKVSFSHDESDGQRAISPWQRLQIQSLGNSKQSDSHATSSSVASSMHSSAQSHNTTSSPGKRSQVIGQLYETLNIISTTKKLATKMAQKATKTADGTFKPSAFGNANTSMLPHHKPTAFQQFQAGIETLLNILEDKFHHEEEILLSIKKHKCKIRRKEKQDEKGKKPTRTSQHSLRGIQEENSEEDDEDEDEDEDGDEEEGVSESESDVSDSDLASVDSLYPPNFHQNRSPDDDEEYAKLKKVHVDHLSKLGEDSEALKLQKKTLRYLPPLEDKKAGQANSPHPQHGHKHHHKHHHHHHAQNSNRFEQYTYQPKSGSSSPDLPSNLKPLCILPAYYVLEEMLGVVFEVKEMFTEFLQWNEQHPNQKPEEFQPSVPTAMKTISHRGTVLELMRNRPTQAMVDAHHINQKSAQERAKEDHRKLMKGTAIENEDPIDVVATKEEDVPTVRKRTYSSFVLPGSVASHLISGLQVNSTNPADAIGDDDDEDEFEVMIQSNEWKNLHADLLEGLSLAIKNLELFEYLPSHLNWTICKPLLLENLQLFLAEK